MKRYLLTPSLLLIGALVGAQTVTPGNTTRHTGAGTGMVLATHADGTAVQRLQSCLDLAPDVFEGVCKVFFKKGPAPVPVVCPQAPAASTSATSQACPSGTTGGPIVTTVTETFTMGPPDACLVTSARTSTTAGTCTPVVVPPPPPATGPVTHFSDCQPGAAPGCVQGNNANPGTQAAPKQTPVGLAGTCAPTGTSWVNCQPAGARLLFARGGAWANFALSLENASVTPESPLVLDAYGAGPSPVFRTPSADTFQVGGKWTNTTNDGGYVIRNIRLDGMGTANRGLWLVQNLRGLTLENVDIENYRFGIESSPGTPHNVTGLMIRNSRINNNRSMGILGSYSDSVIENSTFEGNNNITGSTGNHAIYFSHGNRVTIRNNTFTGNSVVNGSCIGGNVTVHGVVDGLLIEGNTIRQVRSAISCYGFAITAGYTTAESFRNVVVRGNTIINVGMTSIGANASPGIVIENNRIINTQAAGQYGIWIPANGGADAGDAAEGGGIVRNNTICFAQAQGSVGVSAPSAQQSGNVVRTGADATTGACAL